MYIICSWLVSECRWKLDFPRTAEISHMLFFLCVTVSGSNLCFWIYPAQRGLGSGGYQCLAWTLLSRPSLCRSFWLWFWLGPLTPCQAEGSREPANPWILLGACYVMLHVLVFLVTAKSQHIVSQCSAGVLSGSGVHEQRVVGAKST